jgi:hypothetical protein
MGTWQQITWTLWKHWCEKAQAFANVLMPDERCPHCKQRPEAEFIRVMSAR